MIILINQQTFYHLFYFVFIVSHFILAARANCLLQGSDLLSINSYSEKQYINKILQQRYRSTYAFWIGLNDRDYTNLFRWSDGSPVNIVNWQSSSPNDNSGK